MKKKKTLLLVLLLTIAVFPPLMGIRAQGDVDAGPDVTVEQESYAGTQVVLNGTATDDVSTRFNSTWSENGAVLKEESNVTDTTLVYMFTLGTHIVTLNATDEAGNIGSDNVKITVVDTTPQKSPSKLHLILCGLQTTSTFRWKPPLQFMMPLTLHQQ
jgi:hypothetical protein